MALEPNAPPVPPARRRFPAFVSLELALDVAERAAVLLLFLLFVNRMLPRLVQLVLIQREHPEVILLAAGVNAQALLLTTPATASAFVPETLVTILMLMGLLVQISGKLALGRSFGLVPANRGVKTRGLYRVVRHPIYAGYTLTHIGFLLGFPSLQNAALYAGVFAIEVTRLMREEAALKRDPVYGEYAARVRYRLLPGVF
jgi:protein-S-isoprenylcysteine O-methyltransferase Ste14